MTIGFVGAGHMGGAMLKGLAASPLSPALIVCDAAPGRAAALAEELGERASAAQSPAALAAAADVVVCCVRPGDLAGVLAEVATAFTAGKSPLVLSIAAGRTTAWIEARLPPCARVVRAMPNLGVSAGAGATAFCAGANATQDDLATVRAILESFGIAVQLPEKDINAVTALSGSGPAFIAWALQAMVDGATTIGLQPDAATALALQTLLGTAKVLSRPGAAPVPEFIAAVATPGGTTAAGKAVLDASDAKAVFAATIKAAADRAAELAAK